MLTYFDESYDGAHSYLVLGALFIPSPKKIHNALRDLKRNQGYVDKHGLGREIKYNYCSDHSHYVVAAGTVDCFMDSDAWFRAIVVDQRPESGFDLNRFGRPDEPTALKNAKAYKKFTELLLRFNTSTFTNGVLLTDRMTRYKGDAFPALINELFGESDAGYSMGKAAPIFRHIQEVDTALEQYQLGQIGDILQGVILNELVPTQNRWKRRLRHYVEKALGVETLGRDYWSSLPKWKQDQIHPKYQIWYSELTP